MSYIDKFIASIEKEGTAKVTKKYLKYAPDGFENYSSSELGTYILSLRPKNKQEISNMCSRINAYAKWLVKNSLVKNDSLSLNVLSIDKEELWERAKLDAEVMLISHTKYESIIRKIQTAEEYNPLYFEVLFRSIYEGIFIEGLSVLENLQNSDIDGNVVSLRDNSGNTFRLRVSTTLARQLQELSAINIWVSPISNSIRKTTMRGLDHNSVFKCEERLEATPKNLSATYHTKFRHIRDKYICQPLSMRNLYISGIVHRIKKLLEMNHLSLNEAFSDNHQNDIARTIISKELIRCNGIVQPENFIAHVREHLDIFEDDSTEDIPDEFFDDIATQEQVDVFLEGKEYLDSHLAHERNKEVVELAKARFKESHNGKLYCEKCGFDFREKYGERGNDFIEVHHTKAIAKRKRNEPTEIDDLALLCSNCHSIIHKQQPWLTMSELEAILKDSENLPSKCPP